MDKHGHDYDAEATALFGEFQSPLQQKITPQLFVKLPMDGGYLNQRSCGYRVESVLSFESAYTQIGGNPEEMEEKKEPGSNTLVTAVVEGLNVLDVVTADKVVAQISTKHPKREDGYIPKINFVGTRFENLRIAGRKIEPKLNLDLFEEKPPNDARYTQSPSFKKAVLDQHATIQQRHTGFENLIEGFLGRFNLVPESFREMPPDEEVVECSLVNTVEDYDEKHCFGHVIRVPHFGTIYLATLKLTHSKCEVKGGYGTKTLLELTMLDIQMGCAATGHVSASVGKTNGMPSVG
ncbi:hypothetical protein [Acidicapsa acidisoli]|uniref:hypothetical protein n=1 Tax=Acidicapsa acidisoli TaxID=1615681 RepID=UPI0021DF7659|nr:hypothetical protein [Acidicapsa acidisoli]